ncbi:MAG: NAD(+) synthase [Muribaculaceae bacterium]|nr:NAD(+) synthase [Muribaculaceae bacterium]
MNEGFFRAVAAVPAVTPASPAANVKAIRDLLLRIRRELPDVDLIVMPELCITGYTCADLFHNRNLLDAASAAVAELAGCPEARDLTLVVGAPVEAGGSLYNCAVVLHDGVLCIVPKTYLPNYNEFYEKRWFAAASDEPVSPVDYAGFEAVPFGCRQLFVCSGVKVGVEICEDLWAPVAPGTKAALAGAEVVVNLSASDDLIGKYAYLSDLVKSQSARAICGYVYASAGYGESSTDLVFDGKAMIAENGTMLARNRRWTRTAQYVAADIDIEAIRRDRMHIGTFGDCARREACGGYSVAGATLKAAPVSEDWRLLRKVNPMPFVPSDAEHLAERCEEIINIQVAGLARRLDFTRCRSLVVGISGGLDSTLALLVAVRAFDSLQLDRKGIHGVTMPGFGTTGRTYNNALALMRALGVSVSEIPIAKAVMQHFSDIGHDPDVHDVTYENSQARERTQILMDLANRTGGMVLGTGDLSELALGWATYNGDHMSMYGVNASVPKTLVRHLTRYFADTCDDKLCRDTLLDIIDTPVSPELLPADAEGNIAQKTEDLVGPYELHDFFLYYTLRYGFASSRIRLLALNAFEGIYDAATIDKWLGVFVRRFFAQQFKRSCLPDGPKVGSVCLSPRGDWRMPSDASREAFEKMINDK